MSDMSGGPYDGLTLKVSPEALRSAAQTAQSHINNMVQLFEAVDQLVFRSQGYWQGEAGDFHRKSYEQRKEDIQLALKRLKEHPGDLLAMAEVYDTAERGAGELAAALPSDVLS
ncbi:MAG: WXG100 family type VII secretion target [Clostridiales bacterium]|nr:WXG100 family type VII secretion target [Clostridiales bacterium]